MDNEHVVTCNSFLQILGNNECFEPYTSNIYVRRVLSGEFTVVNQHLLMDLTSLGLWSADLKNELVAANGSVQVMPFGERVGTQTTLMLSGGMSRAVTEVQQ